MSLIVFNYLGLDERKRKNMRLLMDDRSIKGLVHVVYDVIVNLDKFVFPANCSA